MARNFRTDVEKVIEEATVDIISGSSYTYQSASFLITDSGSVTQFHSPILIPVASASAMPNPQHGTGSLYVKYTDDKIYFKNSHGTEYNLTDTGGGGGGDLGEITGSNLMIDGSTSGTINFVNDGRIYIKDNDAGSLVISEATNVYMNFNTTDSSEAIAFYKTARLRDDVKLTFGNGDDVSIEYDEDGTDTLIIDGAATKFTVAGVEIENGSTAGAAALTIDNDDADQIALDIDAANITANAVDIVADALTTAAVMSVSANALTTGGILNLVSDSPDGSDRTLVKVTNDNTGAIGTTVMHLKSDAVTDDNPILLIESTAADTGPVLELRNTNAGVNREAVLKFTRSDSSAEADDMDLGRLQFQGVDDDNNDLIYAAILVEASDVTDGDEGGLIKFRVQSGGTAGSATQNTLLSIGGEDVTGGVVSAVVVNEDGINCDFRVESEGEDEAIFLDASANTLYINKGETDFVTQIHNTTDVAITVNSNGIIFNEDGSAMDFRVETDNNNTMFYVGGSGDVVSVSAKSSHHNADFAVFNDYHGTTFENRLSSGNYGSAEILKFSTGTSTLTEGQIFYLRTAGNWVEADADATSAEAQKNLLAVGLGGNAQTVGVLLRGFIRVPSTEILNTPSFPAGLPLFLSTTAGHFDFTAPSSSGDFVRIVGYAIDEDGGDVLVYFNPDSTFVEIA